MEKLFIGILNMSIASCILILFVILIRLIFRRAPKAFLCILWAFVGLRLICPFTLQSAVCLIPDSQSFIEDFFWQENNTLSQTEISDDKPELSQDRTHKTNEEYENKDSGMNKDHTAKQDESSRGYAHQVQESTPENEKRSDNMNHNSNETSFDTRNILLSVFSYIWVLAAMIIFVSALIRYFMLIYRLRGAAADKRGFYYSDRIETPFILGILRPRIYLPEETEDSDLEYIIEHERAHLRRLDHIWKPIGFFILCLHWFNPLAWVAYFLFCKDTELACDEKVVYNYSFEKRKEYSRALINCSERKNPMDHVTLAFGESGVKERVINVLSYKKPAFWVIIICVLAAAGICVFLMTAPVSKKETVSESISDRSNSSKQGDTDLLAVGIPDEKPLGSVMGEAVLVDPDKWVFSKNGLAPKDGDWTKLINDDSIDCSSMTYKYYLDIDYAKPDMRKITSKEFADILFSEDYDDNIMKTVAEDGFEWNDDGFNPIIIDFNRSDKVLNAVQKIQYFPDKYYSGSELNAIHFIYELPKYFYFPDSYEIDERRIELSINYNAMELIREEYDEYGDIEAKQCIYSYPYELEKAALEKYGCSEEREARRLEYPYTKRIMTSPVPPDTGKKLVGEEVKVPESVTYSPDTKIRYSYAAKLQEQYDKTINGTDAFEGTLEYQNQIACAKAYPDMRKITAEEVIEIFNKAPIYEGVDYDNLENMASWVKNNINEIQKIQYYPDVTNNGILPDAAWVYWPDADTVEERKQEIQIFGEGLVRIVFYDRDQHRKKIEDVFNLAQKIENMKDSGTPFDKFPLKRKVTAEEVKTIFEKAEIDINADYKDREVRIEWTKKVIQKISEIQPYPDWGSDDHSSVFVYWPDANSVGDRKTEIQINAESGMVILLVFNNNNNTVISNEVLFDLQKKLTEMNN